MKIKWTNAALAAIREEMSKNPTISGSELAAIFKCTRNAMIGICHRNGIHLKGTPPFHSRGGDLRPRRQPISSKNFLLKHPRPMPQQEVVTAFRPKTSYVNAGGGCQWPEGEPGTPGFKLCDDFVVRGSYCQHHSEMAYVKLIKNDFNQKGFVPYFRKAR